ncbi:type II toxin-antitoxin system VapC family toxin [Frankia sp. Cppng1_Ct_nod]|uniref:type II toxin-antitoxin system VapC family toxin n=1 Tax=Frankia sp. Cppng1_Ct_nod TaxID=2897162 RepID=UPI00104179E0|nr:type II toxin-antitoxin system VapC family toxin [Frankia sp. Cppng1_Ct_nod]
MRSVVLDTDASSLIIKKRLPITLASKLINSQPIITFVTRAELTKWAEVRNWGTGNRTLLAEWMAGVPMSPGDENVADTYGVLSAAGVRRGRPRPMNDIEPINKLGHRYQPRATPQRPVHRADPHPPPGPLPGHAATA